MRLVSGVSPGQGAVWWALAVCQHAGRIDIKGRERGHYQLQRCGERRETREERRTKVSSAAGARCWGRSERRLEGVRLGLGQWLDAPCAGRLRSCGWSGLLRA